LAEVKLATRQVGKALGGIDETLLVTMADDGPSIFVVLQATSLTSGGAEESLLSRFRELARISAPLGAYLMPVDPRKAVGGVLSLSLEPVQLDPKGWPYSLSTADYDFLTVESEEKRLRARGRGLQKGSGPERRVKGFSSRCEANPVEALALVGGLPGDGEEDSMAKAGRVHDLPR